jgi:two-component system, cell cycle response regulator
MNLIEWLAGPNGRIASAASVFTILTLLLFMTAMLRRLNRRNAAYRLLAAGVTIAFVPLLWHPVDDRLFAASEGLRLISFILMQYAVLELYAAARVRDRLILCCFLLGAAGTSVFQWFAYDATGPQSLPSAGVTLTPIGLGVLASAALLLSLVLPRVGQKTKFAAALAVYTIYQLVLSVNGAPDIGYPYVQALSAFMPIAYYGILFLLLFERVIERMQSVYVSSIRDGLTGLFVRRHFLKKANRYASRSLTVSILFCDIDNFKKLNDTEGHHKADLVLQHVAEIVSAEVAGNGTAGRYGGEELVAAIARPGVNPADLAEAIRSRVEAETPVTLSIGWCAATDGITIEEAIKLADAAMYVSKTTGKNKVTAHKPSRSKAAAPATV